jgi:hypothetical protein
MYLQLISKDLKCYKGLSTNFEFCLFIFSATILSQGSSNTSAPFKATVVTSSFDSGSPSGRRLSSGQRISAKDGTRILEKFKKATQDDLSPTGNFKKMLLYF